MTKTDGLSRSTARLFLIAVLLFGTWITAQAQNDLGRQEDRGRYQDKDDHREEQDKGDRLGGREKVLYIWAQDQAQVAPDFLAVIDFDEQSPKYGTVIHVVPVPPPGNTGNEPHHCHLNSTKTILGCGGLLSLLKGQNGIFFFNVLDPKKPRFMFSAKAVESSMTDDFLPIEDGGFLITQMGSADGMAPGRVAEFDGRMHFVADHFGTISLFEEWPSKPPLDGFNPHGISARPDLNLMMTSDFILPSSTLMPSMGPVLRGSVRIWNYRKRKITRTINLFSPDGSPAQGTMDVKMLPKDPHGYGYTAGMFDGHIFLIDPEQDIGTVAFDLSTVKPHVDTPVPGGMGQIMATPKSGDRLIVGTFMAGQVVMLDTTDRFHLEQVSVVSFGANAGPHNIVLSDDDSRLVVTDYFLNEDEKGIIHFEGDHKVHVLKVTHDSLTEDKRFNLDFNTAFKTGPARPHGIAMK
ncbi:MAG TPA: selenium-binding protein SBP56-related protein [Edaphobacter sp.]